MSTQAAVYSVASLKDFRASLTLYGEETIAAIGAIDAELRRTAHWLHQDRPNYWQTQIKKRRDDVASARAELFRRKLAKTPDHSPAMSEQKENLRRAEARLQDAERRLALVRKWQKVLPQVVFEYRASSRRIRDLSAGDVPRAVNLLSRIIDALEAYLRTAPPTFSWASGTAPELDSHTDAAFDEVPEALDDANGPAGELGEDLFPPDPKES